MFKKILLITILALTSLSAEAIKWEKDFKSGMKNAVEQQKPVLFVFSRHTCKYCVILDETTFQDERVAKALNRDFISIVSYTDENDFTPRELWRPGTPTLWFLYPDSYPMFQPIQGAIDAENFLNALAIVKEEFDNALKAAAIKNAETNTTKPADANATTVDSNTTVTPDTNSSKKTSK